MGGDGRGDKHDWRERSKINWPFSVSALHILRDKGRQRRREKTSDDRHSPDDN